MPRSQSIITVPPGYPTSSIFIDESGSKASANQFFVLAAVKLRAPGNLARDIKDIRDRHGFTKELKFNGITRSSSAVYFDIIDALWSSDAHLAACVVDGAQANPFDGDRPTWKVHADVAAQLLVGCLNRRELAAVLLDGISTPRGCSYEESVRQKVNARFGCTSIISAVCLDSRTNDLLQVADMVASAILHRRRSTAGLGGTPGSYKDQVAKRLALTFDSPDLSDGRTGRLNVQTFRGASRRSRLRVVRRAPSAG